MEFLKNSSIDPREVSPPEICTIGTFKIYAASADACASNLSPSKINTSIFFFNYNLRYFIR